MLNRFTHLTTLRRHFPFYHVEDSSLLSCLPVTPKHRPSHCLWCTATLLSLLSAQLCQATYYIHIEKCVDRWPVSIFLRRHPQRPPNVLLTRQSIFLFSAISVFILACPRFWWCLGQLRGTQSLPVLSSAHHTTLKVGSYRGCYEVASVILTVKLSLLLYTHKTPD